VFRRVRSKCASAPLSCARSSRSAASSSRSKSAIGGNRRPRVPCPETARDPVVIPVRWPLPLHRLCARVLGVLVAIRAGRASVEVRESAPIAPTVPLVRPVIIGHFSRVYRAEKLASAPTQAPPSRRGTYPLPSTSGEVLGRPGRVSAVMTQVRDVLPLSQTKSRCPRLVNASERAVSALFHCFPFLDALAKTRLC
jgi:hypothetical protein